MRDVWTVSALNDDIKNLLYEHYEFLWIEGEVSDLHRPSSGHLYFYLKDERSRIRAVIFRMSSSTSALGFDLENGMHILCHARLTVYSPRGEYQLIVDRVEPLGLGALQKAYEALKARLQAEGLFDPARKRPIPFLPQRIGVVTSPSGAVIRDILHITARRFPSVHIVIAPVHVQGIEAPAEIAAAINHLHEIEVDVIILARGGGSFEDLYPFNTEEVARAVVSSRVPIISAIGHETDFTIADFVADLRAPTPSAAAELAVPSRDDLIATVDTLFHRLITTWRRDMDRRLLQTIDLERRLRHPRQQWESCREQLTRHVGRLHRLMAFHLSRHRRDVEYLTSRLMAFGHEITADTYRPAIQSYRNSLALLMRHRLAQEKERLTARSRALETLSPLGVLNRGYSITTKSPEGWIVRDAESVHRGDDVHIQLSRGHLQARVEKIG